MLSGLFIGLALALSPSPEVPAPAEAVFDTEIGDARCFASRRHGEGAISIEAMPLSNSFSVTIIDRGKPPSAASMAGALVTDGGASLPGSILAGSSAVGGRMVRIMLPQRLEPAALGASLGIRGAGVRTALYPVGDPVVLAAFFDRCRATLVARWKIDAAALARVTRQAEPIAPETWVVREDYPQLETRKEVIGPAIGLIAIGVDGRVEDCRVVGPSAVPYFDDMTCQAVRRKGRHRPARDGDGNAVRSWVTRAFVWHPPRA